MLVRPRQLFRRLTASPGFTAVALLTIAAGIGANATIFGVVNGVLLKPLPYAEPDRLIAILHRAPGLKIDDLPASPSSYLIYREQGRSFEDVGLWNKYTLSVTDVAEPEEVAGIQVTDGVLPMLGVRPLHGRLFTKKDDSAGAPETAILSYGFWQHKFGGDPAVVGRRVRIDGDAREIVGILPQSFRFLDQAPAIYIPYQFNRSKLFIGNFSHRGIARLKPGVTMEQAAADITRLIPVMERSFPPPPGFNLKMFEDAHLGPNLRSLEREVVGDVGKTLWIIMSTIGLVLLIACANVANLLLVRADGRQHELAIRAALGASWQQLAGDILAESILLGVLGGGLGLALAFGALRALVAAAPANLPRVTDISIDLPTVLFTAAISLLAGLLFGLIPAVKYAGSRLSSGLRQGDRNSSTSRERHRARNGLVIIQVTLAVVLLVSSGLMLRTAHALTQVQPGFADPATLQTMQISIPDAQVPEAEKVVRTMSALRKAISDIPGVQSVALANSVPLDDQGTFDPVFARDRAYDEHAIPIRRYEYISPGLFATLGAHLVAGRDYDWFDIYNRRPVAIVSERLAREYWGSAQKALGKQVRDNLADPWREVIGVAGDIRYAGLNQAPPDMVYWPFAMNNFEGDKDNVQRTMSFVVRSKRTGSESFVKELRQAVWSVNPALPVANVSTLATYMSHSMARTSFTLVMLAIAACMALLLGVVGIYGVIAYSVSQRRREIGVRMAIGAQSAQLLNMFLRSGLALTAAGIVLGELLSGALMRLMSSLLFGVEPVDAPTYAAAAVALLAAALLASLLPSLRALRVDPAEALRAE